MLTPSPKQGLALELVPIPATAGIGLKPQHYTEILARKPSLDWFEVHPENYMGDGGAPHYYLDRIRQNYELSLHGVGLSIGAARPLDKVHLARLKKVADRYAPGLLSEHLAWSTHDDTYLNDLLPLPYTFETLDLVADHVDEVQEFLGRRILIENPSAYLTFEVDAMSETAFLEALATRTGCGLLLDVNNVFVSARNNGFDAEDYIDAFPLHRVEEIHLAGHAELVEESEGSLLIDTHDREVRDEVWQLYARVIARRGRLATLIEWDNEIPSLDTLIGEARAANRILASGGA